MTHLIAADDLVAETRLRDLVAELYFGGSWISLGGPRVIFSVWTAACLQQGKRKNKHYTAHSKRVNSPTEWISVLRAPKLAATVPGYICSIPTSTGDIGPTCEVVPIARAESKTNEQAVW